MILMVPCVVLILPEEILWQRITREMFYNIREDFVNLYYNRHDFDVPILDFYNFLILDLTTQDFGNV